MSWRYRRRRRITLRTVVAALGKLLIAFGALVLLFVVYLLWGTGLLEASHQHALRQQFERELHEIQGRRGNATPTSTIPGSTSTTAGFSGVQPATPGLVAAEGQPIGILVIPKIGLDKVVVEGTGTADLRLGPGHYPGTPLPGQQGNAAIAGHRTTYGAPFYNLNEISPGDPIIVTTVQGRFLYDVTSTQVVSPNDTVVVATTSSTPELTLTTCNPRFSATSRLIVHAVLAPHQAVAPTPPRPRSATKHARTTTTTGLAGEQGSFGGAVAWGAAFLALGIVVWMVARRRRLGWVVYTVGAVPMLVVLFFFFENLSPLLPASF